MFHRTHWTQKKVDHRLRLIAPLAHRRRLELDPFQHCRQEGPDAPDGGNWEEIRPGDFWGAPRTNFTLKTRFQVPHGWNNPALYLPLGESGDFSHPEALVSLDGRAYAGTDRHHHEVFLPPEMVDGREHLVELRGWTGLGADWQRDDPSHRLQMRPCYLVEICPLTRAFLAKARVALGLSRTLAENDPARGRLLNGLYESFQLLDTREPLDERFYESLSPATEVLEEAMNGGALEVEIVAAGHAHIDVGWLWPVGQTRQKSGRTFHTVDRLMDEFPDYHFSQSQPQLYDYVRQDFPELFERIKARVAEGRWEILGGLWVEADANLSGAEALVRQLVLGRSFFRRHFGEAESPVLWLPDVFGYSWSLPQLIKQAGLEYFFTIKIGWSRSNRVPYDSFWWQGIDGTRVLTHFSTTPDPAGHHAATYNAVVTPEQFVGTWHNFQQKESQDVLLMAYGYGDGGGGPTREMLENLRELAQAPSAPRARMSTVGEFFRLMEERSGDRLPVWNGELYLEYHRGTYTTQAALKWGNRKGEVALHQLEFLATLAVLQEDTYRYPRGRVQECWELLCLNQFHDILPGSSIRQVNVEAQADHQQILATCAELQEEALAALRSHHGGRLVIYNPTSFPWRRPLRYHGAHALDSGQEGWLLPPVVLPYGVLGFESAAEPEDPVTVSERLLENRFLRVEFDRQGRITRIFDRIEQREVLPAGKVANELQLFEDRPLQWDAWDVDIFYQERKWTPQSAEPVKVLEEGPLVGALGVLYRTGDSGIRQTIRLCCDSPLLEFETEVDWRERHTLLKAAFPVDLLAVEAKYEIQWGHVSRPTHRNTSWDWARFECPAQRWVDLSEGDYGVSLLNDCKYGHDVSDGLLRITLLRSPTMPDPEADQGLHRFTYALLPHRGPLGMETISAAYQLNFPALVVEGEGRATEPFSLVTPSPENLVVETVKPAEDADGWVIRCYEANRSRGRGRLRLGFEPGAVAVTNLLEQEQERLTPQQLLELDYLPFQIRTLKIR